MDELAEAALRSLAPAAVVARAPGSTADTLRALARAARAQKNARRVFSGFLDSVLPGFARVSQALRTSGDCELLPLLEEALQAGLFAPSLAAGHVAAASALAARSEPREPGKRQRKDDGSAAAAKGDPSAAQTPQSLLYSAVCERVRAGTSTAAHPLRRCAHSPPAGEASYVSLLPWLLSCVATLSAGGAAPQAGPGSHSFALLCALLSALEESMTDACARSDAGAWCSSVAAAGGLLGDAHRLGVLVHVADSPEALPAHLSLVLQQCSTLESSLASASAASLLAPLIDIDTRLVALHLQPAWRAVWLGSASAPEPCRAAACNLIAAFGDTRQLDVLLAEAAAAMRSSRPSETAGLATVMCSPDVAAAWFAASARAPAAQVSLIVQAVSSCLVQAVSAQVSGDQTMSQLSPLAETLASTLSGVCVTPATAPAVSLAAAALQARIDEMAVPLSALEPAVQPAAAILIRIASVNCQLSRHCAETAGVAADVAAAAGTFQRLCCARDAAIPLAPWLRLELSRFALRWMPGPAAEHAFELLTLPFLRADAGSSWDGTVSTVCADTLPCAIWSLCTEHTHVWCALPSSCRDFF